MKGANVIAADGDMRLGAVVVRTRDEERRMPIDALFILIGGEPFTQGVEGWLRRDEHGRLEFTRADVIYGQGDPCDTVLYIKSGGVKLSVLSKTGREAVVAIQRNN